MPISDCEVRDPRIRRTRQLLQDALRKLLLKKDFDKILVQDITDEATVNRATFYDHYTDKFALYDAMIGGRFHQLLLDRNIQFEENCPEAFQKIIRSVCDYYVEVNTEQTDSTCHRATGPFMESAITSAVRYVLLDGFVQQKLQVEPSPEIVASSLSWAICGAVKEWYSLPDRPSAQKIVPKISKLLQPLIGNAH